MVRVTLSITGMSCLHCVKNLASIIELFPEIKVVSLDVGSAVLDIDELSVNISDTVNKLEFSIQEEGYSVLKKDFVVLEKT